MNSQIENNLFEFWEHIGKLNNRLFKGTKYSAVSMINSDWPNRVFDLQKDFEIEKEIKNLSKKNELPEIITTTKPHDLSNNTDFEFLFKQKNMALDLNYNYSPVVNPNIKRVNSRNDSINFAYTASETFGYRVDYEVVLNIVNNSDKVKLFIYQENEDCLGCGIVFFDSSNNAGLHMIGTIPKGRGKGIGRSMTEKLIMEAKENNAKHCVLHASFMGEPIYKKLGFETYGEIETYRILIN